MRRLAWVVLLCAGACGAGDDSPAIDGATADAAGPDAPAPPWPSCAACACTSTGLLPMPELAAATYMGREGGLYPGGGTARPAAHETTGLAAAQGIVPRDSAGAPDPNGSYVLVSIGMSNTTQEFSAFVPMGTADPLRDPHLAIVDGAQGGQTAGVWADPTSMPWTVLQQRLTAAGVTAEQVAVAWIKVADPGPSAAFEPFVTTLSGEIVAIANNLKQRFPNLGVAYLSSRIYAGYATGVSMLNPEPFAYQSGFAVKQVLADQIAGDPSLAPSVAPWLSWGPYLWADGTTPRAGDGLVWICSDLAPDGTHPVTSGRQKVAQMLLDFFRTDTTAREWFLASP